MKVYFAVVERPFGGGAILLLRKKLERLRAFGANGARVPKNLIRKTPFLKQCDPPLLHDPMIEGMAVSYLDNCSRTSKAVRKPALIAAAWRSATDTESFWQDTC